MAAIIEYSAQYKAVFKAINLEWLEHYQLLETHDVEVLDEPGKYILDGGGHIYLAKEGEEIVGSAAIINTGDGVFELAKMAVAPLHRGKGLSRLLIEKCLEKARQLGVKKLILYSNSQLQTAIALYTKYGFIHIPLGESPFITADVKMELSLL